MTAPPEGRYGPPADPRTRRRWVIALWVLGIAGLGVTVWLGLRVADTPVTWQDVGFRIEADQVEVVTDVTRPDPSVAVSCRIEALNRSHAQVGVVVVEVPPSRTPTVRLTTTVRTTSPAVTGVADECWAAGG